jgi:two-component system sensor histidine kinase RpfC
MTMNMANSAAAPRTRAKKDTMVFNARDLDEREVMRNRLCLAGLAFVAAVVARHDGEAARDFFEAGLPILLAYLIGSTVLLAHIAWRPAISAPRLVLAFAMDSLAISTAMVQGGAAGAYLFPLYLWLILGAGARLGGAFLGLAVALALAGFSCVVALTPFWRANSALAASLALSIVVLPLYGAVLLRHIAAARAQAERANRAKTLFLASVSHELRTPLTAILGLSGLLENSPLDAEQRDMARTLSEAAQNLLCQIEGLLAGARDEIGGEKSREETIDLFALLVSLRALLAVEAEAKGVRLGLMIETGTPRHIRGDRRHLQEIFQNVVGNAVKFTQAGAVAIRVGASFGSSRGSGDGECLWLNVEIRDTGVGIDPRAQALIFEPFSQGDPTIRARYGGAGLGLAIVRRRLEAIGGEIAVESRRGDGAQFRLRWPVTEAPVAEDCPELEEGQSEPPCLPVTENFDSLAIARGHALAVLARDADASSLARAHRIAAQLASLRQILPAQAAPGSRLKKSRLKILLAEDNEVNGRVLAKILAGAGHEARVVGDGEAALLSMIAEDFDVILLDMNMPRLGGVEAARIYASARPDSRPKGRAPVLALTADDSPERQLMCMEAGMTACLRKPIAPDDLIAALDAALHEPPPALAASGRCEQLDPATLQALARLGGADFVRELLVQFAVDAALLVEEITSSFARGDLAALRRQSHALESMAGNLGALALVRLCRAWRAMSEEKLGLSAPREAEKLRGDWRTTQESIGQSIGQSLGQSLGQALAA